MFNELYHYPRSRFNLHFNLFQDLNFPKVPKFVFNGDLKWRVRDYHRNIFKGRSIKFKSQEVQGKFHELFQEAETILDVLSRFLNFLIYVDHDIDAGTYRCVELLLERWAEYNSRAATCSNSNTKSSQLKAIAQHFDEMIWVILDKDSTVYEGRELDLIKYLKDAESYRQRLRPTFYSTEQLGIRQRVQAILKFHLPVLTVPCRSSRSFLITSESKEVWLHDCECAQHEFYPERDYD